MVKTDCFYFPLDRPCVFHKQSGIVCEKCSKYLPVIAKRKIKKILVIKLGASGDVLRTTFLLPGIKEKYGKTSEITWIVAEGSEPILTSNPYLDRIWPMDSEIFTRLLSESFDNVINLDLSPESLALSSLAVASKKSGYWLDSRRKIQSSNSFAKRWLMMSASDKLKKENRKTYQFWMSKITGIGKPDSEIFTPLIRESVEKAKEFAFKNKLSSGKIVGINPGAGKRWKLKKWTQSGYQEIIEKLSGIGIKVLLFGGPEEKEIISLLVKKSKGTVISTGTNNSIPDFFALLNLCAVLITGDTLALHAALGLKKKVVAIFGPTSAAEIELYGRGVKVVSPAECVCCYHQNCDIKPDCMEQISQDEIWTILQKIFSKVNKVRV